MKFRSLISLFAATVFLCAPVTLYASGRGWESLRAERNDARTVARDTDIEIKTAPSTIIVSLSRPMPVKVYTILGRLISSENLAAGTSQLHIPAHGVYIIKIGGFACKVAV